MPYARFLPLLLLLAVACRPKPVWQRAAEQYCDCLREYGARPRSAMDTLEYAKVICKARLIERYHDAKVFYIDMTYVPIERDINWQEREHSRVFMNEFTQRVRQQGYRQVD